MNTFNNFFHHYVHNFSRQGLILFKFLLLLLLVFFLTGCDNNRNDEHDVHKTPPAVVLQDEHDRDTTRIRSFAEQRDEYRIRLNKRITELKEEIETEKRIRKANSGDKDSEDRIARREERRRNFQERLDRLETQTETGWQNFKTELDDLFKRDNDKDSIR
jgi:hypothetical protein